MNLDIDELRRVVSCGAGLTGSELIHIIDRLQAAESKCQCTMGVGYGGGNLFVHGDYESIKAAQAIVLEREELTERLKIAHEHLEVKESIAKQLRESVGTLQSRLDEMESQEAVAKLRIIGGMWSTQLLRQDLNVSLKDGLMLYAKPMPAQQPQDSAEPVRERRLSQHSDSGHERDVQIRRQSLHRFNSADFTIEPAKRRLSDIKLEGHVLRDEL